MKIIVDAFGGDNAPLEIIKGCAQAVQQLGVDIILTGRKDTIAHVARENTVSLDHMEIVDCPDVMNMNAAGTEILRSGKNSSMAVGLQLLAKGNGDAFVTAGNSGAVTAGATFLVKRIKGVKRIAFAPVIPCKKGFFMLVDAGANVDCKPEMLKQFGIMGSIYMKRVMQVESPRVGLLNVGTEEHKGGELQHGAFALLKDSPLNFIGNVEARDVPDGVANVLVADGFSGNVFLKSFEGVSMMVLGLFKGVLTKNMKNKLAASMVLGDLKALKKRMDYNEYGGAPLLGCAKPVFKAHGSATAKTLYNALRLTKSYVEGNVPDEIAKSVAAYQQKEAEQKAGTAE
ncbi:MULTISPECIES: phosphate acyltransferase PlsX [Caproicibacterium]|jgi:glycerol-3-phosphate acyltransferase PlsX|uniref:Phosphate acyltransferase n=1 Tax=Caproicibacterium lactatifermentans TaxID=2666138 RepID=A0A859DQQ3_9FIRM|nr:phosphate acyltransferase PlsX [Caproicibacterium lactatifermentans]ARP50428.1 phosphate--acyl-ACP acyltransferase [Ruminococcaceae bacterium CPB6]MDD4807286.1 phosphate acyltransferase PlsX [Oscillospiraceae bacterium]QKN23849.1 phosphate acyltransferase PlsX [Caproicibacterium lactatifermentans]